MSDELDKLCTTHFSLADNGVISVDDKFVTEAMAASEIDPEEVKKIDTFRENLMVAGTKAVAAIGTKAFTDDKELNEVGAEFKVGKDKVKLGFRRSQTTRNPQTGETGVKHGVSQAAWTVYAAQNKGALKKVRTELSDNAAKALCD